GEAQVLDPVLDEGEATHVAAFLLALLHGTESACGGEAGLFQGKAGGEALLDLALPVVAQLLVQLLLDPSPEEQRAKTQPEPGEPPHHPLLTIREMAAERRSHCSASRPSSLRPARVSA